MKGFQEKIRKTSIFGHFGPKLPNLGQFWQNRAIFEISTKKVKTQLSFDSRDYASSKKLGNSDVRFWKKNAKTLIFGHFDQIYVKFGSILAKTGHLWNFPQKVKTSFFKLQRLCFEQKMWKPFIFGHFRPKRPILEVFGQNSQNGENYQKSAWNIFSHTYKCTVSEKK